jgi:hypothetical protein
MTTDDPHVLLGAFVLGGLSDDDHRAFSEHLRACPHCQQELGQVSGLPHLLDLADLDSVQPPASAPASAPPRGLDDEPDAAVRRGPSSPRGAAGDGLARLLDEVARRRRRARARSALVAAAAAVLLVAGGMWLGPRLPGSGPDAVHYTAVAAGSPARADVALVSRGWGTQLDITCEDMPTDGELLLWVVDASGRSTSVASWRATTGGYATVTGATALRANEIRHIEVRTDTGRVVASAHT